MFFIFPYLKIVFNQNAIGGIWVFPIFVKRLCFPNGGCISIRFRFFDFSHFAAISIVKLAAGI